MVALHNIDHFVVRSLRSLLVEKSGITGFKLHYRINSHASFSYLRETAQLASAVLAVSRAENRRFLYLRGDCMDDVGDAVFAICLPNSYLLAYKSSYCFRHGF
jgi:hypothetical protein